MKYKTRVCVVRNHLAHLHSIVKVFKICDCVVCLGEIRYHRFFCMTIWRKTFSGWAVMSHFMGVASITPCLGKQGGVSGTRSFLLACRIAGQITRKKFADPSQRGNLRKGKLYTCCACTAATSRAWVYCGRIFARHQKRRAEG